MRRLVGGKVVGRWLVRGKGGEEVGCYFLMLLCMIVFN